MKLATILMGLSLTANTWSDTTLSIVKDFEKATIESIWKKVPANSVPKQLISQVTIEDPSELYNTPFKKLFFQNEMFALCYDECDSRQPLKVKSEGADWIIPLRKETGFMGHTNKAGNGKTIRQGTVYYWIEKLFNKLEELDFTPQTKLQVYVDRDIKDITTNVRLENNAFYMPSTNSLSFLPAKNTFLSKLMQGKLRPSAYDPTVVVHEAGHFVFQELTGGVNLNTEISGFNEGFADYLAMITLNTAGIGTVMLSGKVLRDAEKTVNYTTQQPVHELGNAFSGALWKVRNLISDKATADKIVLEIARKIGKNPLATAFDIPRYHVQAASEAGVSPIITQQIPGIYQSRNITGSYSVKNIDDLKQHKATSEFIGFNATVELPEDSSEIWGMEETLNNNITIMETVVLNQKNTDDKEYYAIKAKQNRSDVETAYWIVKEKSSQNIIATYDMNFNPAESAQDLEQIKVINESLGEIEKFSQIVSMDAFIDQVLSKDLTRLSDLESTKTTVVINGKNVAATKYEAKVKLNIIGRLANIVTSGMVRMIKTISVTVINDPEFNSVLPKFEDKGHLVGYETRLRSGVNIKFVISNIGQ